MIPKIIHYCWFGGKPLPESALKCINSWKIFLPDYEIKEWNEKNFNINCCAYVKEAYSAQKYAFVSDYARFWILYNYGGLYLDTDVEIIKNIDEIIEKGSFLGTELWTNKENMVNPGSGMAACSGLFFYKQMLDFYESIHFIQEDGSFDQTTIVQYTTDILSKYGFTSSEKIQKILDIYIYPHDYFSPKNYKTGILTITENTVSIHHYTATWHSRLENLIIKIELTKSDKIYEYKIRRIISFPFRVFNKINKLGLKETIKFSRNKHYKRM